MAVIVQDGFSGEGSNVELDLHTPDTTGNQWVELSQSDTPFLRVESATSDVRLSGTTPSAHDMKSSRPNPTSAEYDVQARHHTVDTGGDETQGMYARATSATTYYFFIAAPTAAGGAGCRLGKMVSGTPTVLDSDATLANSNNTWKFEIRNAAKKVYEAGVEVLSTTNDDITSAGECGLAVGNFGDTSTDDITGLANFFDDYIVTEVAGSGALSINKSDAITVADTPTVRLNPLLFNVSDTVTVADSPTVRMSLYIPTVTDAVSVADSPTMNVVVMPSVADAITVAEAITARIHLNVNIDEPVTVADAPTVSIPGGPLEINAADAVVVIDAPTVIFSAPQISVADSITVGESTTTNVVVMPSVADAVTVVDAIAMNVILMPNVSDAVSIAESVRVHVLLFINVNDAVTVADAPTVSVVAISALQINVSDAVTLAEVVTVTGPSLVATESLVGERWKASVNKRKKDAR